MYLIKHLITFHCRDRNGQTTILSPFDYWIAQNKTKQSKSIHQQDHTVQTWPLKLSETSTASIKTLFNSVCHTFVLISRTKYQPDSLVMQRLTSNFLQTAIFTYLTACWRLIVWKKKDKVEKQHKKNTWLLPLEDYITARVLKTQHAKPKMPLIFTGYQSNTQTYERTLCIIT